MSNEAAERLCPACHHTDHDPGSCEECPSCELHYDEAFAWAVGGDPELFADERRAVVERIRVAVHRDAQVIPEIGEQVSNWIDAILDAEAAREGVQ